MVSQGGRVGGPAIDRLRARDEFKIHAFTYLVVNTMVVLVWAFLGGGFFWPIFLLAFWGMGLAINGYEVYGRDGDPARASRRR